MAIAKVDLLFLLVDTRKMSNHFFNIEIKEVSRLCISWNVAFPGEMLGLTAASQRSITLQGWEYTEQGGIQWKGTGHCQEHLCVYSESGETSLRKVREGWNEKGSSGEPVSTGERSGEDLWGREVLVNLGAESVLTQALKKLVDFMGKTAWALGQNESFKSTLKLKKVFTGPCFQEDVFIIYVYFPCAWCSNCWEFVLLAVPDPQPPGCCSFCYFFSPLQKCYLATRFTFK